MGDLRRRHHTPARSAHGRALGRLVRGRTPSSACAVARHKVKVAGIVQNKSEGSAPAWLEL